MERLAGGRPDGRRSRHAAPVLAAATRRSAGRNPPRWRPRCGAERAGVDLRFAMRSPTSIFLLLLALGLPSTGCELAVRFDRDKIVEAGVEFDADFGLDGSASPDADGATDATIMDGAIDGSDGSPGGDAASDASEGGLDGSSDSAPDATP